MLGYFIKVSHTVITCKYLFSDIFIRLLLPIGLDISDVMGVLVHMVSPCKLSFPMIGFGNLGITSLEVEPEKIVHVSLKITFQINEATSGGDCVRLYQLLNWITCALAQNILQTSSESNIFFIFFEIKNEGWRSQPS
jgi:hypothetical protein